MGLGQELVLLGAGVWELVPSLAIQVTPPPLVAALLEMVVGLELGLEPLVVQGQPQGLVRELVVVGLLVVLGLVVAVVVP